MLEATWAVIVQLYERILLQLDKPNIGGPLATFGLAMALVMGLSDIFTGSPFHEINFLLVAATTICLSLLGQVVAIFLCPKELLESRLGVAQRMMLQMFQRYQ